MTTARGGKKKPLPANYETRDHLTPIMRGGVKKLHGHTVRCCNRCNMEKGCLTFDEFRAVHAYRKNKLLVSPGKIFAGDTSLWKLVVDFCVAAVLIFCVRKGHLL
jgi:hypothetical protein